MIILFVATSWGCSDDVRVAPNNLSDLGVDATNDVPVDAIKDRPSSDASANTPNDMAVASDMALTDVADMSGARRRLSDT